MAQVSRGRRLMGEINVVPYIDVMLVLLIIFMITAPLLTQGVKVDLPKAGAEPLDPQTVAARATAALRRNPELAVLVKADTAVAYGRVVQAMVILQQAGAKKLGFITDPLPQPPRHGS